MDLSRKNAVLLSNSAHSNTELTAREELANELQARARIALRGSLDTPAASTKDGPSGANPLLSSIDSVLVVRRRWQCCCYCCCRRRVVDFEFHDARSYFSSSFNSSASVGRWMSAMSGFEPGLENGSCTPCAEEVMASKMSFQAEVLRNLDSAVFTSRDGFDERQLASAGWMDCSAPGKATCFFQTVRDRPVGGHTVTVVAVLDTEKSTPEFAFVTTVPSSLRRGTSILTSPMAFAFEAALWPQWFPFCREVAVLKAWGPDEQLLHVIFSTMGMSSDTVLYQFQRDRLHEDEPCIEYISASPPGTASGEATSWLGIQIPAARKGTVRMHCPFNRVRQYPKTWVSSRLILQTQMELRASAIDWIYKQIWKLLTSKMISLLVKKFQSCSRNGAGFDPELEERLAKKQESMVRLRKRLQEILDQASPE